VYVMYKIRGGESMPWYTGTYVVGLALQCTGSGGCSSTVTYVFIFYSFYANAKLIKVY